MPSTSRCATWPRASDSRAPVRSWNSCSTARSASASRLACSCKRHESTTMCCRTVATDEGDDVVATGSPDAPWLLLARALAAAAAPTRPLEPVELAACSWPTCGASGAPCLEKADTWRGPSAGSATMVETRSGAGCGRRAGTPSAAAAGGGAGAGCSGRDECAGCAGCATPELAAASGRGSSAVAGEGAAGGMSLPAS